MTAWDKYQIYVYVAAAALLSWWLVQFNAHDEVGVIVAQDSPDFFSNGYYKKQMDQAGFVKNELSAAKMTHSKERADTQLEKPVMTLYSPGQAPWVIVAEHAVLASNGDDLQLLGDNLISREALKRNAALTVKTRDLNVKLSTHFAKTDAWAEIVSPPNKTSGTGMEATFVSPVHLKFFSKVKGRYEIK
ncbi:MAG: hypothetical protein RL563_2318 [Pseudomonadota bacterium]|jgi:lipopolysaccharide export system protein LptC